MTKENGSLSEYVRSLSLRDSKCYLKRLMITPLSVAGRSDRINVTCGGMARRLHLPGRGARCGYSKEKLVAYESLDTFSYVLNDNTCYKT